jgi:hypothetical protein
MRLDCEVEILILHDSVRGRRLRLMRESLRDSRIILWLTASYFFLPPFLAGAFAPPFLGAAFLVPPFAAATMRHLLPRT